MRRNKQPTLRAQIKKEKKQPRALRVSFVLFVFLNFLVPSNHERTHPRRRQKHSHGHR